MLRGMDELPDSPSADPRTHDCPECGHACDCGYPSECIHHLSFDCDHGEDKEKEHSGHGKQGVGQ